MKDKNQLIIIGRKIKSAMKKSHLSNNDVAIALGVTKGSITLYRSGAREMSVYKALKFAELTNTSADDYLTRETKNKAIAIENANIIEKTWDKNSAFIGLLEWCGYHVNILRIDGKTCFKIEPFKKRELKTVPDELTDIESDVRKAVKLIVDRAIINKNLKELQHEKEHRSLF